MRSGLTVFRKFGSSTLQQKHYTPLAHSSSKQNTFKQYWGSGTFRYGSGSSNPSVRLTNGSGYGSGMPKNIRIRNTGKKSRSHKSEEIKVFLTIFAWWWKDPEPNPGDPKHKDSAPDSPTMLSRTLSSSNEKCSILHYNMPSRIFGQLVWYGI